jgi:hypothetical protein
VIFGGRARGDVTGRKWVRIGKEGVEPGKNEILEGFHKFFIPSSSARVSLLTSAAPKNTVQRDNKRRAIVFLEEGNIVMSSP